MAIYSIPQMPLPYSIWRWSHWGGLVPPVSVPDAQSFCNLVPGRRNYLSLDGGLSYILILLSDDIRFSELGVWIVPPGPTDPDLIELPTGSGRYYKVVDVEQLGMGFSNWHQEAAILKVSPWPVPVPPIGGSLLLEDGTAYLLEDGTLILLE
jgi:hypothetical protein